MAIDWEAVKRDWENGKPDGSDFTSRELADKYQCSHTMINKRAKGSPDKKTGKPTRPPWRKDVRREIAKRTEQILIQDEFRNASDEEAIEEAALKRAEVVRDLRAAIQQQRELVEDTRDLLRKRMAFMKGLTQGPSDDSLRLLGTLSAQLTKQFEQLQKMTLEAYRLHSAPVDEEEGNGIYDPDREITDLTRAVAALISGGTEGTAPGA